MINIIISSLVKLGDLWNIYGFWTVHNVIVLTADSCQMADSTVSVQTSKEAEKS